MNARTAVVAVCLLAATVAALAAPAHIVNQALDLAASTEKCTYSLAETIPQEMEDDLPVQKGGMYTYQAWLDLINSAKSSLEFSAFYWNLNNTDTKGYGERGREVLLAIENAARRGVSVRIAQNYGMNLNDSDMLVSMGLATARTLHFDDILGAGVLHTKFIIADHQSFYIGSANMDWLSLAQVKEFGILVKNCPTLASDLYKIWEVYYEIGGTQKVPSTFPKSVWTSFNMDSPLPVTFNSSDKGDIFFGSSPPPFNAPHRTSDIDGLVATMDNATDSICIMVMDYVPAAVYVHPRYYWPNIDDAIRRAVYDRGVNVRMLIGNWTHSAPDFTAYLRSLYDMGQACQMSSYSCHGSVDVKIFNVPPLKDGRVYPYSRVNHAKYMVTDNKAFIHTSNWSADYFINTGGVSLVSTHDAVRTQVQGAFDRDWNSKFSTSLE